MDGQNQRCNFRQTHTAYKRINSQNENKYAGLRNQGATCYLNSVLQTLFMTEDFRNYVQSWGSQEKNNLTFKSAHQQNHDLTHELAKLFESLKGGNCGNTEGITKALKIENVYEQQDAVKWFLKILNEVGPEVSKPFQGIMEYTTTCKNPKTAHKPKKQIDNLLSMPISLDTPSPINVQLCFKSFFNTVSISGKNQLYCQTCEDMMDMETNCSMTKVPPVLVLHLQRFELDYSTMSYRKNTSRVKIPSKLKVKSVKDHVYELYAVVNHSGSLHGGHYYAEIKSFEDQMWYEFNDSTVHKCDRLEKPCDQAYLLFYKYDARSLHSKSEMSEKDSSEAKSGEEVVNEEFTKEEKTDKLESLHNKNKSPEEQEHDLPSVPFTSESKPLSEAAGVNVQSSKPEVSEKDSSDANPGESKEEESNDAESSNKSENLQTKSKNPEEQKPDHSSVPSTSDQDQDETQKPPSEDESKANTQQALAVVESGLGPLDPESDVKITDQNHNVNNTPGPDQTDDSARNPESEAKIKDNRNTPAESKSEDSHDEKHNDQSESSSPSKTMRQSSTV